MLRLFRQKREDGGTGQRQVGDVRIQRCAGEVNAVYGQVADIQRSRAIAISGNRSGYSQGAAAFDGTAIHRARIQSQGSALFHCKAHRSRIAGVAGKLDAGGNLHFGVCGDAAEVSVWCFRKIGDDQITIARDRQTVGLGGREVQGCTSCNLIGIHGIQVRIGSEIQGLINACGNIKCIGKARQVCVFCKVGNRYPATAGDS